MKVNIKVEEGVDLPLHETVNSAGFDLRVNKIIKAYKGDSETETDKLERMQVGFTDRKFIKLRPFERILFGTGIFVELPSNIELQIRPRSGTALKRGLTVINSPGTIDADYRGEVGVIIYNSTPFLNKVEFNERVAQGVLKEVIQAEWNIVTELSETERGEGGFGSTGKT